MLPDIPDGAHCAFTTIGEPQPGDLVALWLKPEKVPAGEPPVRIKRLVTAIPPFVRFPYREHPESELHALRRRAVPARNQGYRHRDRLGRGNLAPGLEHFPAKWGPVRRSKCDHWSIFRRSGNRFAAANAISRERHVGNSILILLMN